MLCAVDDDVHEDEAIVFNVLKRFAELRFQL
ncbi:Uncharacterised protein [Klebsiella pneumoniae]|nr:Uncharacterised protein [Klebsiella pneumoniae]